MLLSFLKSLQGYGVTLQRRSDRLFMQSVTVSLDERQKQALRTYKPLLLVVLPNGGVCHIGLLVDVFEAFEERLAIMAEAGDVSESVMQLVAVEQAQLMIDTALSSPVPPSNTLRETPVEDNLSGF